MASMFEEMMKENKELAKKDMEKNIHEMELWSGQLGVMEASFSLREEYVACMQIANDDGEKGRYMQMYTDSIVNTINGAKEAIQRIVRLSDLVLSRYTEFSCICGIGTELAPIYMRALYKEREIFAQYEEMIEKFRAEWESDEELEEQHHNMRARVWFHIEKLPVYVEQGIYHYETRVKKFINTNGYTIDD